MKRIFIAIIVICMMLTTTTTIASIVFCCDINQDGVVDILDLVLVGKHFGESPPTDARTDLNKDGTVDILDLVLIVRHWGESIQTMLEKFTGDNQSGVIGTKLPEPLVVLVKHQYDDPLPDVQVDFAVTQGNGSVNPISVLTDANGMASTELTLGQTIGLNQVTATVNGLSVTFSAMATAATVSIADAEGEVGGSVKVPIILDNDVAGVGSINVTVTYDAAVLTATATSNYSDAMVAFWRLDNLPEGQVIVGGFSLDGVDLVADTLLTIVFEVNADAAAGTESEIVLTEVLLTDVEAKNDIPVETENGKFTVIDTTPPRLDWAFADSPYTLAGNTVTITLFVSEASPLSSVTADIESPDETVIATIPLVDDGTNGDETARDHVFTGQWNVTFEANFVVDFSATDTYANTGIADNLTNFTSLPPPTPSANVLLVDDDNNNNPNLGKPKAYNEYYQEALDALGYSYDVWNIYYYGSPDSAFLSHYLSGIVIWETGDDYWSTLTADDQVALATYLDTGGNLFISGLVGFDLDWFGNDEDRAFYNNYLHATMVGFPFLHSLSGVSGDPITDGININISGGDGADNNWNPNEIDPLDPAISIFIYQETPTSSTVSKKQGFSHTEHDNIERLLHQSSLGWANSEALMKLVGGKEFKPESIESSGTGALRVDNGVYKVVYFAFGFEAIDNAVDRNTLVGRVIQFLAGIDGVRGDVSGDGKVTAHDASLVLQYILGLTDFSIAQQQAADVTGNNTITALDAALILQYTVGLITQFPVRGAPILVDKDENQLLAKIIGELEDFSLSTEQKHVLEQLKRLFWQQALPKQTALLQNYPNPFNPETWLPYQLARDASVTISIYNTKGQLVRTIGLGNKKAGIYVTKDKAAYWDGRDSLGEKVASGVYYYTLQVREAIPSIGAGKFRATRKAIILK